MKRNILLTIWIAHAGVTTAMAQAPRNHLFDGGSPHAAPMPAAAAKVATSSSVSCAICGPTFRGGKTLSIQGSTTLRPIIDRMNQTVAIQDGIEVFERNLGSTTGVRALLEGECARRGTWTAMGPCDLGADGVVGTGNGPADIGISSRPTTAAEVAVANAEGICFVEHPVAIDGLGIIINNDPACSASFPLLAGQGLATYLTANLPGPPLGGLSETQIKEILFGNDSATLAGTTPLFKQWCDLTGCGAGSLPNITVVSRQEEGGTYGAFLDLYVCNTLDSTARPSKCVSPAMFPKNTGSAVDPFEWIRPPSSCTPTSCGGNDPVVINPALGSSPTQFVGSNDEVVNLVANTCGAIGYAGISFIDTAILNGANIRSFPVTQTLAQPPVPASFATTLDGTFDFTRKLYAYTVGTPYGKDPRAIYLDTLYGRLGQANVFEAGFVPANGVLPRNAGNSVAAQAQVLLETIGAELIETTADRIATKLAIVAAAEAVLADPMASAADKANARTDLAESEFSVREAVDQDNDLVRRLRARVDGCIGGTCRDAARASSELAKADADYAAAQAELAVNDPLTPINEFIEHSDFDRYVGALGTAFDRLVTADLACN